MAEEIRQGSSFGFSRGQDDDVSGHRSASKALGLVPFAQSEARRIKGSADELGIRFPEHLRTAIGTPHQQDRFGQIERVEQLRGVGRDDDLCPVLRPQDMLGERRKRTRMDVVLRFLDAYESPRLNNRATRPPSSKVRKVICSGTPRMSRVAE